MGCVVASEVQSSKRVEQIKKNIKRNSSSSLKFSKENLKIDGNSYMEVSRTSKSRKSTAISASISQKNSQQQQYGCTKLGQIMPYKPESQQIQNKTLQNTKRQSQDEIEQFFNQEDQFWIEENEQELSQDQQIQPRRFSLAEKLSENEFQVNKEDIKRRNSQKYSQFHLKKQIQKQMFLRALRKYHNNNQIVQYEQKQQYQQKQLQCYKNNQQYQIPEQKVYSWTSKRELKFKQFNFLKTTTFLRRAKMGCNIEPCANNNDIPDYQ